jgi:hypothetical protein
MSKLFYDCPINAAYMVNKFGIKLYRIRFADEPDNIEIVRLSSLAVDCGFALTDPAIVQDYRYYVHPDSMPLFTLEAGDLVRFRENHAAYVLGDDLMSVPASRSKYADPCFWFDKTQLREIIQRNEVPFICPEIET